jgi:hypothetical protein
MKARLHLYAVLALLIAVPANAQYIYMDVNADGVCTTADQLSSSVTSFDIWLNTNHNANGTLTTCVTNPSQPLDIFSYDIVFHVAGSGSVTFNSWTNTAAGFQLLNALTTAGADAGVGYTAPLGGNIAPGLLKLGTMSVTVTGTPMISFVGLSTEPTIPSFGTGYGSLCDASTYANTMVLGTDFFDSCASTITSDVESTTWGKIKMLYR